MEKSNQCAEKTTIMQAYERLDRNCYILKDLEKLTFKLNEKLNRTERNVPYDDDCVSLKPEPEPTMNIAQLLNRISDRIEKSINEIGNITEKSIGMID